MLMPLGRLAPATIEQCDRRADLGGCGRRRVVERVNKRFQRLSCVIARP